MNDELLNERVRDMVMALLSLAATAYEVNYISKYLDSRPEPVEQKIEALKQADQEIDNPEFDNAARKILKYYVNKSKKLTPHVIRQSTTSNRLIDFIKKYEHFAPKPYWDYKQYSIGYGTKASPNDKHISLGEAIKRLNSEVAKHRNATIEDGKRWGYKWTPHQIDALTSFRYNVGSLNNLTNNGKRPNHIISKKILEYNTAGGKELPGLTKRRMAEHKMFIAKN